MPDLPPHSLRPYGPTAWLIQLADPNDIEFLHHLASQTHPLCQEWVVAYDSLLILTHHPQPEAKIQQLLHSLAKTTSSTQPPQHHEVHVHYDGPDLTEVAHHSGLSPNEVVTLHSQAQYRVRFLGFSPGFAYLDGLPKALHLPRRATPRPHMAKGAVAIGGTHAGIYTIPSPGGWNWLGNTDHPLFQPGASPDAAFTLKVGDTLTFIPA
ncbi:allophanate hydrolase subunit 1 [Rubritalea tangerina]|uniref:Allophanate hydrolase subunit 1 n=2 Tax=Rubritalea tangerina TaxID=430798 RepID=A0ABW4ZE73_9BACT